MNGAPPPPPPSGESTKPSLSDRYASAGFTAPDPVSAPDGSSGLESTRPRNANDPNKTLFILALYAVVIIALAVVGFIVFTSSGSDNASAVDPDALIEETAPIVPTAEPVEDTSAEAARPPWMPTYVPDDPSIATTPDQTPPAGTTQTEASTQTSSATPDPVPEVVPPVPEEEPEDTGPLTVDPYAYNAATKSTSISYGEQITYGYDGTKTASAVLGYTATEYFLVNGATYELGNAAYEQNKFTTLYLAPPVASSIACTDEDPLMQYMKANLETSGQQMTQEQLDEVCAAMSPARFPAGTYTYKVEVLDVSGALFGSYEAQQFTVSE